MIENRKRGARLLAALALLVALCVSASAAHATTPAAPGGVALTACKGLGIAARCGSLTVPLDRANPGLGTTRIAFALVPHRGSGPSAGTILYNPGGPGAGSISRAKDLATGLLRPLMGRRDLLLVDVRGSGRSDALKCGALDLGSLLDGDGSAVAGACGRSLGARISGYGSAAAADDFDAVRAALGIERLDLWGESYGTYLMPIYAARHPQHVRSIVLSGAYPIDFDPWGRPQLAAARRAIRLVCARTHRCDGDAVLRDVARLAERLRRHPVPFTVTLNGKRFRDRLDEDALAAQLYADLSSDVYGRLPAAVSSALAGDDAALVQLARNSRLLFAPFVAQDPATLGVFSAASNYAIQCHDYPRAYSAADPPAVRRATFDRELAALDPRAFWPLSPRAWVHVGIEGSDDCVDWPADPTAGRPLAPGTPFPDVPTLVLSGDLDANTPSAAGRQAAAQFPHGRFVEVPNVGHTPSDSPCGAELGLRFVATLRVRAEACKGTGEPPSVVGRAPIHARQLGRIVHARASAPQRRALGLVVATFADLVAEYPTIADSGAGAPGLRGGQYAPTAGGVAVRRVRVVVDARVSGTLAPGHGRTLGELRLSGRGVPNGRLRVRLGNDRRGTASGVLDGRRVRLAFGF